MNDTLDILKDTFRDAIIATDDFRGDEAAVIAKDFLHGVGLYLHDELGFSMLIDLCAVDYPDREERFEVVYHLYALEAGKRLRIKVRAAEADATVPSVHEIWPAANWFEREAFDLFGICFDGHPNLKRLLTFEGFEGHPLRKDYDKRKRQAIPQTDPLVSITKNG